MNFVLISSLPFFSLSFFSHLPFHNLSQPWSVPADLLFKRKHLFRPRYSRLNWNILISQLLEMLINLSKKSLFLKTIKIRQRTVVCVCVCVRARRGCVWAGLWAHARSIGKNDFDHSPLLETDLYRWPYLSRQQFPLVPKAFYRIFSFPGWGQGYVKCSR